MTVTWAIGFAIPNAVALLVLISLGAILASLGVPGMSALVAACAPPRIRSQAFAAFGLALAVCGAAAAPLAVGGLSELFQQRWGLDEGDSLRYAMTIAAASVTTVGTWLVFLASRTAAADAQQVLALFLAEHTRPGGRLEAGA